MCKARKGVKDLSILPQGLPAVFMAGLPAVFMAGLPAVRMAGKSAGLYKINDFFMSTFFSIYRLIL